MPTLVIGLPTGERVRIDGQLRTERDREDCLRVYDSEDTEVAEFPSGSYAVREQELVE